MSVNQNVPLMNRILQPVDQTSPIFDMENLTNNNDLNIVEELDEFQEDEKSSSTKSLNTSRDETVASGGADINGLIFKTSPMPSSLPSRSRISNSLASILHNKAGEFNKQQLLTLSPPEKRFSASSSSINPICENLQETENLFECDRTSLNRMSAANNNNNNDANNQASNAKHVNISTTAFNTFSKIIPILGPVLTCKYCCIDLLKMLAICYMNPKCLNLIETGGK